MRVRTEMTSQRRRPSLEGGAEVLRLGGPCGGPCKNPWKKWQQSVCGVWRAVVCQVQLSPQAGS